MHDHLIYTSYSSDSYLLLLFVIVAGAATFHILANATRPQWLPRQEPPLGRYPIYSYRSSQRHGAETLTEIWPGNDAVAFFKVSITVNLPREAGSYPLIVYLPAPTELAACADQRYQSWVEAGYVVAVVSQARYASSPDEKPAANFDDKQVLRISELLSHLEMQDAPPFDRIDFKTTVFAGCGASVGTARALADACSSGIGTASQTGSLQILVIQAPHTGEIAKVRERAVASCGDLAIFVPQKGGKESTLRYASYALPDTSSSRRSSAPEIAHTAVTQHLSLGFLDATVKNDATAIEWLERDAGRWLEPVGELCRVK